MATEAVLRLERNLLPVSEDVRLKVAILGFGTVGRAVAGILFDEQLAGLELSHIFNRDVARKRVEWTNQSVQWTESIDEVLNSDVDVIVESMGGLEPAREWIKAALASGKSVVTANKQLIARHGQELGEIAGSNECQLLFGASVAGGVPVITALEHGLAGDRIESVCGILNGTCNYILSTMEQGAPFETALKQAQELGYAEADPTDDIAGYDTRAKLVILARVSLGTDLSVDDISCSSISNIAPVDFEYAREIACTIRQIGQAEINGNRSFVTVEPMLVPQDSPLARAQGCENVVIASGKFGGKTAFSGAGAGGNATAVAVVSDLLSLTRTPRRPALPRRESRQFETGGDCVAPYYLRFVVKDRPGIVATIAGVLAKFGINVDAVFQKPGYDKGKLPFVITVESSSAAKLNAALDEISKCEFLVDAPLKLRIFGH
jgi:homoserine dehydrogenase